jgi:hypothetical protein
MVSSDREGAEVKTAATHPDPVTLMQADRDQLTHLLRGLAARLDALDRRLADLAWRGRGAQIGVALGEWLCERTALESERDRLGERLCVLAEQLKSIDTRLSNTDFASLQPATRVGTCPYCGYPSIGSGLCAFCRPHLAR